MIAFHAVAVNTNLQENEGKKLSSFQLSCPWINYWSKSQKTCYKNMSTNLMTATWCITTSYQNIQICKFSPMLQQLIHSKHRFLLSLPLHPVCVPNYKEGQEPSIKLRNYSCYFTINWDKHVLSTNPQQPQIFFMIQHINAWTTYSSLFFHIFYNILAIAAQMLPNFSAENTCMHPAKSNWFFPKKRQ
jgi:hypothetical protein